MHRVELKDSPSCIIKICLRVPNAPCGVERNIWIIGYGLDYMFLMHRVELKG